MRRLIRHRVFVAAILALVFVSAARAQNYKVEQANAAPPAELSAAVRAVLGDQVLRVSGPNALISEIWVRKEVPAKSAPSQDLGITYGQLDEGTVVAAIRFPADLKDYRRQLVHAGVYVLRYCLSPVNGNHQGVAPQRDFLIAVPAAVDQDPATVSEAQTIELGRKTTGTTHPSVWSLFPGAGDAGAAPVITHDTDNDLWILSFTATIGSAPARIGLVVAGFGPEA